MRRRATPRTTPVLATSFDSGAPVLVEHTARLASPPSTSPAPRATGYEVPRSGWPAQAHPIIHQHPEPPRSDPAEPDPVLPGPALGPIVETDLHSDIQSIVRQAAAPQPAPPRSTQAARAAESRTRIFDDLAASMAHARSYDLGSVSLDQRFDDFDREADAPAARHTTGRPLPPPTTPPVPAPMPRSSATDFIEDLDLIRSQSDIPLDPGVGGRSISEAALEPGDVILSTTTQLISKAIRDVTGSEVSHASLYIGNGNVVEAIGDGVLIRSLETSLADDSLAVAYRHRDMTPVKATQVVAFAEQHAQAKTSYDHWGVIQVAPGQLLRAICNRYEGAARTACLAAVNRIRVGTNDDGSFFCSELVLAAFKNAGLSITNTDPSWSSPGQIVELHHNGLFDYVGHLIA